MEVIGRTPYYSVDYSDPISIQYLSSKTGTDVEAIEQIVSFLTELKVIDQEIWENKRHIWCQSFVDSITDVYRKRKDYVPDKYSFLDDVLVSGVGNEQSKGKERKKKKREQKKEAKYEEMKTVYCPNAHGKAEIPVSKIGLIACGKCDGVLIEDDNLIFN
tara:strand:- start:679 stop:1158 length:480 start_codon:yes stop_codon:yes gene_type:complete